MANLFDILSLNISKVKDEDKGDIKTPKSVAAKDYSSDKAPSSVDDSLNVDEHKNNPIPNLACKDEALSDQDVGSHDQPSEKDELDTLKQFTIPKKKKEKKDLFEEVSITSRECKGEILHYITQSYKDRSADNKFKYRRSLFVHNEQLLCRFLEKRKEMRSEGYSEKDLTDSYAFLRLNHLEEVRRLCTDGVKIGNSRTSYLGHPEMGVSLCRHADIISSEGLQTGGRGKLLICKVIKGKAKAVAENKTTLYLEPTPNYDCHISKTSNVDLSNTTMQQALEATKLYAYEYGDLGVEPYPRQILPFAVVDFMYIGEGGQSKSNKSKPSTLQKPSPLRTPKASPQRVAVAGQGTQGVLGSGYVVWSGQLSSKGTFLCEVELVSYTSPAKPARICSPLHICARLPLSAACTRYMPQLASLPRDQEVSLGQKYYNYCELHPSKNDQGKFNRLMTFLAKQDMAAVVRLDEDTDMVIMTNCSVTQNLGLSVVNHHPMILHCIFVAGASRFKAASKVFRTPLSTLGAKNLPTPPPIVVGRSGESSPSLGRLQSPSFHGDREHDGGDPRFREPPKPTRVFKEQYESEKFDEGFDTDSAIKTKVAPVLVLENFLKQAKLQDRRNIDLARRAKRGNAVMPSQSKLPELQYERETVSVPPLPPPPLPPLTRRHSVDVHSPAGLPDPSSPYNVSPAFRRSASEEANQMHAMAGNVPGFSPLQQSFPQTGLHPGVLPTYHPMSLHHQRSGDQQLAPPEPSPATATSQQENLTNASPASSHAGVTPNPPSEDTNQQAVINLSSRLWELIDDFASHASNETESSTDQPEAAAPSPRSGTVNPSPFSVNPKHISAKPSPVAEKPTSVAGNLIPVVAKPVPVTAKPVPVVANPIPVVAKPVPVSPSSFSFANPFGSHGAPSQIPTITSSRSAGIEPTAHPRDPRLAQNLTRSLSVTLTRLPLSVVQRAMPPRNYLPMATATSPIRAPVAPPIRPTAPVGTDMVRPRKTEGLLTDELCEDGKGKQEAKRKRKKSSSASSSSGSKKSSSSKKSEKKRKRSSLKKEEDSHEMSQDLADFIVRGPRLKQEHHTVKSEDGKPKAKLCDLNFFNDNVDTAHRTKKDKRPEKDNKPRVRIDTAQDMKAWLDSGFKDANSMKQILDDAVLPPKQKRGPSAEELLRRKKEKRRQRQKEIEARRVKKKDDQEKKVANSKLKSWVYANQLKSAKDENILESLSVGVSRTAIKSLGKIPKKKSTTTGSECSSNGGRKPVPDDVAVAESVIELDAADQQAYEEWLANHTAEPENPPTDNTPQVDSHPTPKGTTTPHVPHSGNKVAAVETMRAGPTSAVVKGPAVERAPALPVPPVAGLANEPTGEKDIGVPVGKAAVGQEAAGVAGREGVGTGCVLLCGATSQASVSPAGLSMAEYLALLAGRWRRESRGEGSGGVSAEDDEEEEEELDILVFEDHAVTVGEGEDLQIVIDVPEDERVSAVVSEKTTKEDIYHEAAISALHCFDDDDDAEAEPVEGEKLRSYAVLHEVIHCVPSMLREAANREVIAKKEQAQEAATGAVTAEEVDGLAPDDVNMPGESSGLQTSSEEADKQDTDSTALQADNKTVLLAGEVASSVPDVVPAAGETAATATVQSCDKENQNEAVFSAPAAPPVSLPGNTGSKSVTERLKDLSQQRQSNERLKDLSKRPSSEQTVERRKARRPTPFSRHNRAPTWDSGARFYGPSKDLQELLRNLTKDSHRHHRIESSEGTPSEKQGILSENLPKVAGRFRGFKFTRSCVEPGRAKMELQGFPRVESVNNEVFAPDDMADFEARRARTQLFDATIAGSINEDRDRNTENQQQLNQYQDWAVDELGNGQDNDERRTDEGEKKETSPQSHHPSSGSDHRDKKGRRRESAESGASWESNVPSPDEDAASPMSPGAYEERARLRSDAREKWPFSLQRIHSDHNIQEYTPGEHSQLPQADIDIDQLRDPRLVRQVTSLLVQIKMAPAVLGEFLEVLSEEGLTMEVIEDILYFLETREMACLPQSGCLESHWENQPMKFMVSPSALTVTVTSQSRVHPEVPESSMQWLKAEPQVCKEGGECVESAFSAIKRSVPEVSDVGAMLDCWMKTADWDSPRDAPVSAMDNFAVSNFTKLLLLQETCEAAPEEARGDGTASGVIKIPGLDVETQSSSNTTDSLNIDIDTINLSDVNSPLESSSGSKHLQQQSQHQQETSMAEALKKVQLAYNTELRRSNSTSRSSSGSPARYEPSHSNSGFDSQDSSLRDVGYGKTSESLLKSMKLFEKQLQWDSEERMVACLNDGVRCVNLRPLTFGKDIQSQKSIVDCVEVEMERLQSSLNSLSREESLQVENKDGDKLPWSHLPELSTVALKGASQQPCHLETLGSYLERWEKDRPLELILKGKRCGDSTLFENPERKNETVEKIITSYKALKPGRKCEAVDEIFRKYEGSFSAEFLNVLSDCQLLEDAREIKQHSTPSKSKSPRRGHSTKKKRRSRSSNLQTFYDEFDDSLISGQDSNKESSPLKSFKDDAETEPVAMETLASVDAAISSSLKEITSMLNSNLKETIEESQMDTSHADGNELKGSLISLRPLRIEPNIGDEFRMQLKKGKQPMLVEPLSIKVEEVASVASSEQYSPSRPTEDQFSPASPAPSPPCPSGTNQGRDQVSQGEVQKESCSIKNSHRKGGFEESKFCRKADIRYQDASHSQSCDPYNLKVKPNFSVLFDPMNEPPLYNSHILPWGLQHYGLLEEYPTDQLQGLTTESLQPENSFSWSLALARNKMCSVENVKEVEERGMAGSKQMRSTENNSEKSERPKAASVSLQVKTNAHENICQGKKQQGSDQIGRVIDQKTVYGDVNAAGTAVDTAATSAAAATVTTAVATTVAPSPPIHLPPNLLSTSVRSPAATACISSSHKKPTTSDTQCEEVVLPSAEGKDTTPADLGGSSSPVKESSDPSRQAGSPAPPTSSPKAAESREPPSPGVKSKEAHCAFKTNEYGTPIIDPSSSKEGVRENVGDDSKEVLKEADGSLAEVSSEQVEKTRSSAKLDEAVASMIIKTSAPDATPVESSPTKKPSARTSLLTKAFLQAVEAKKRAKLRQEQKLSASENTQDTQLKPGRKKAKAPAPMGPIKKTLYKPPSHLPFKVLRAGKLSAAVHPSVEEGRGHSTGTHMAPAPTTARQQHGRESENASLTAHDQDGRESKHAPSSVVEERNPVPESQEKEEEKKSIDPIWSTTEKTFIQCLERLTELGLKKSSYEWSFDQQSNALNHLAALSQTTKSLFNQKRSAGLMGPTEDPTKALTSMYFKAMESSQRIKVEETSKQQPTLPALSEDPTKALTSIYSKAMESSQRIKVEETSKEQPTLSALSEDPTKALTHMQSRAMESINKINVEETSKQQPTLSEDPTKALTCMYSKAMESSQRIKVEETSKQQSALSARKESILNKVARKRLLEKRRHKSLNPDSISSEKLDSSPQISPGSAGSRGESTYPKQEKISKWDITSSSSGTSGKREVLDDTVRQQSTSLLGTNTGSMHKKLRTEQETHTFVKAEKSDSSGIAKYRNFPIVIEKQNLVKASSYDSQSDSVSTLHIKGDIGLKTSGPLHISNTSDGSAAEKKLGISSKKEEKESSAKDQAEIEASKLDIDKIVSSECSVKDSSLLGSRVQRERCTTTSTEPVVSSTLELASIPLPPSALSQPISVLAGRSTASTKTQGQPIPVLSKSKVTPRSSQIKAGAHKGPQALYQAKAITYELEDKQQFIQSVVSGHAIDSQHMSSPSHFQAWLPRGVPSETHHQAVLQQAQYNEQPTAMPHPMSGTAASVYGGPPIPQPPAHSSGGQHQQNIHQNPAGPQPLLSTPTVADDPLLSPEYAQMQEFSQTNSGAYYGQPMDQHRIPDHHQDLGHRPPHHPLHQQPHHQPREPFLQHQRPQLHHPSFPGGNQRPPHPLWSQRGPGGHERSFTPEQRFARPVRPFMASPMEPRTSRPPQMQPHPGVPSGPNFNRPGGPIVRPNLQQSPMRHPGPSPHDGPHYLPGPSEPCSLHMQQQQGATATSSAPFRPCLPFDPRHQNPSSTLQHPHIPGSLRPPHPRQNLPGPHPGHPGHRAPHPYQQGPSLLGSGPENPHGPPLSRPGLGNAQGPPPSRLGPPASRPGSEISQGPPPSKPGTWTSQGAPPSRPGPENSQGPPLSRPGPENSQGPPPSRPGPEIPQDPPVVRPGLETLQRLHGLSMARPGLESSLFPAVTNSGQRTPQVCSTTRPVLHHESQKPRTPAMEQGSPSPGTLAGPTAQGPDLPSDQPSVQVGNEHSLSVKVPGLRTYPTRETSSVCPGAEPPQPSKPHKSPIQSSPSQQQGTKEMVQNIKFNEPLPSQNPKKNLPDSSKEKQPSPDPGQGLSQDKLPEQDVTPGATNRQMGQPELKVVLKRCDELQGQKSHRASAKVIDEPNQPMEGQHQPSSRTNEQKAVGVAAEGSHEHFPLVARTETRRGAAASVGLEGSQEYCPLVASKETRRGDTAAARPDLLSYQFLLFGKPRGIKTQLLQDVIDGSREEESEVRARFQDAHSYVFNHQHDPYCANIKKFLDFVGAREFDPQQSSIPEGHVEVFIYSKSIQKLHEIPNLLQLKLRETIKFQCYNDVYDVKNRSHMLVFQKGGVVVPDSSVLISLPPAHVQVLLEHMRIQCSAGQPWSLKVHARTLKRLQQHSVLADIEKQNHAKEVLAVLRDFNSKGVVDFLGPHDCDESKDDDEVNTFQQCLVQLQIKHHRIFRHIILLSDLLPSSPEGARFTGSGIDVASCSKFLQTYFKVQLRGGTTNTEIGN